MWSSTMNLFIFVSILLLPHLVISGEEWTDANCVGPYTLGKPYSEEEMAAARQFALDLHNKYRSYHGVEPLVYNDTLNKMAQRAAECNVKMEDVRHASSGENIWWGSPEENVTLDADAAVRAFYREYCYATPDYKDDGNGVVKGHYTQVVWKSTLQLGIGIAVGPKRIVLVGRYGPYGNMVSNGEYYPGEILPLKEGVSDEEICCRTKDPKRGWLMEKISEEEKKECIKGGVKANGLGASGKGGGAGPSVEKKSVALVMVVAVSTGLFSFWIRGGGGII